MSRKAPQNLEKMQLKEEISTKRYQNVEEMQHKEEMSMKWPQNVEEMHSKKKMSWKPPQNQEKPQPQRGNVPGSATKSGENEAAERRGSTDATKNAVPTRDGVFYLNGSGELTAEVVEQDVL